MWKRVRKLVLAILILALSTVKSATAEMFSTPEVLTLDRVSMVDVPSCARITHSSTVVVEVC
jgi:hypothetical protein